MTAPLHNLFILFIPARIFLCFGTIMVIFSTSQICVWLVYTSLFIPSTSENVTLNTYFYQPLYTCLILIAYPEAKADFLCMVSQGRCWGIWQQEEQAIISILPIQHSSFFPFTISKYLFKPWYCVITIFCKY